MKPAAVGTGSGCAIWVLAFVIVSTCFCPLAMAGGALASTVGSEWAATMVEPYLCPENSTAEIVTYQTTITDDSGSVGPATGYIMQCVDRAGAVVRDGSPDYAFYVVGVFALGSLVLSALGAFFIAAPLGALIARRRGRAAPAGTL